MRPLLALALLLGLLAPAGAVLPRPRDDVERAAVDLRGTTWEGLGFLGPGHEVPMRYVFEPDGKLTYSYNGATHRNGSWRVEGNVLYFEMNNRFREFRGRVTGASFAGDSWNVRGLRWTTSAQRVTGP